MSDKETLALLRQYLSEGYVLHGSKVKNELLEPRQASDTRSERVSGKQVAVYASEFVEVPLFMALHEKRNKSLPMRSGYSGHDGIFKMYGENCTLGPGYVYVLPRDAFEVESDGKGDEELISRAPVTPVAVIEVRPSILDLLDTVTLELH